MTDGQPQATGLLGQALAAFAAAAAELLGAAGLREWLLRLPMPPSHEDRRLRGLRGRVEIRIDRYGVPHIQAENAADLFFAQGYCHARDRFWQMELGRRVARGELAELFGARAVELDRVFRRLGFRRVAEQELALLDDEVQQALESYSAGVNAYLARHRLPIEFLLLQQMPQPWQVVDTLAFARYMAWNLSFGWESKLIRHQLAGAQGKTGSPALAAVPVLPGGGASNCWAVAPSRSATGRALLASDPHLRPRIPAPWYMAHLQGAGYNVAGATLPGLVGVLVGHNDHVSWGITVAVADCQDWYVERPHPDQARCFAHHDHWYEAESVQETIRVRGGEPVADEIILSRHGPLFSGLLGIPADLPWSFCSTTNSGFSSTKALLQLNRARDWPGFRAALAEWTVPALNFVFADVAGVVAWKLAGRVPIRAGGPTFVPVPGDGDQHEWTGEVPFDELPEIVNPPGGVLASANSQPDAPCRHFISNDWMDDSRKRRIVQLLAARERHSLADMAAMQHDVVSLPARDIAARLCSLLPASDHHEVKYLAGWDGELHPDSIAGAIYEVFRERLLERVYRELPGKMVDYLRGQGVSEPLGHLGSVFHHQGTSMLQRLLDDLLAKERGAAVVGAAFADAIRWLRAHLGPSPGCWRWGRLHRVSFVHLIGRGAPLVDRLLRLSRGPIPLGGDADTIAHAGVDPWHPFEAATFTVSCRQIFDVGDWDRSKFILPTGQSGHPGSVHYDDMVQAWRRGEYRPLLFGARAIQRQTVGRIRLGPAARLGRG